MATYKDLTVNVPQEFLDTVLTFLTVQPSIHFYTTIFLDELEETVDLEDDENEGFVIGILDEDGIKTIEKCFADNMSADETAEQFFNTYLQC